MQPARYILLALSTSLLACGARSSLSDGESLPADDDPGDTGNTGDTGRDCSGVSHTPVQLVALDRYAESDALSIRDGYVYYGVTGARGSSSGEAETHRVPFSGGEDEVILHDDGVHGAIAFDAERLYYADPHHLFARPTAGGPLSLLANPPSQSVVLGLANAAAPGVFWETRQESVSDPMTIAHWDPASTTTTALVTATDLREFFVDESHVYFRGVIPNGQAFFSAPLAGGEPTVLKEFPISPGDGNILEILGIDATHIIYTPSANGGPISRIDKTGGHEAVVVNDTSVLAAWVDDTHVYWSLVDDRSKLVRARTTGGPVETLASEPKRFIHSIATDTCRVVWSVENPPAILMRAR